MTVYAGDEFYDDDVTSGLLDDYGDPDELDCTWCGGEGVSTCDDPLGCPGPHIGGSPFVGGECPCRPCKGTGRRSEQTVF